MRWVLVWVLGVGGCAAGGRVVVSREAPQPFCTRTLGAVECFADPEALLDRPSRLGDTPVRTHMSCDSIWRNGGPLCALASPERP